MEDRGKGGLRGCLDEKGGVASAKRLAARRIQGRGDGPLTKKKTTNGPAKKERRKLAIGDHKASRHGQAGGVSIQEKQFRGHETNVQREKELREIPDSVSVMNQKYTEGPICVFSRRGIHPHRGEGKKALEGGI